jgi:uncharacterized protein
LSSAGDCGYGGQLMNAPLPQPFHVLSKPIGPICNLDCAYCFYLDKKDELFPGKHQFRMSREVLERYVRSYIDGQPAGLKEISFAWQGGEPTLMGIPFFKEAVKYQARYAPPGVHISNVIQTNGTLLDDEWGQFLKEHEFLVGLSVDGPRELHDAYRYDIRGAGTFDEVMRGLDILAKHDVAFNTLTVLNNLNSKHPRKLYDFLYQSGSRHFQFIPLIEFQNGSLHARSVSAVQFGKFLCGIFDRWLEQDHVGQVFVQHFEVMLNAMMGFGSPICVHAKTCGRALAIEHTGDVYSCDHYVNAPHRLGNVLHESMAEMVQSARQQTFGQDKYETLPQKCLDCEYLKFCYGGCPKDRHTRTQEEGKTLNSLCRGYEMFYGHALPVIEKMALCLQQGISPADYRRFS